MSLLETLAAELAALHVQQIEGLHAQAPALRKADHLAQRLQSAGINAHAEGRIRADGSVASWIRAHGTVPRIRSALEKLDVVEANTEDYLAISELHVEGVVIHAFEPLAEPA